MPGFNQRGPMNEGAMTGRGRGICTGNVESGTPFPGRGNAAGFGMGMGRGRGRRGGGQGYGQGRGYGQWNAPTPTRTGETLQARADMLEAELAAVKEQLKNLSETGEK